MNGVSRLLSLALLGAALHWAPAQAEEQPRLFELLGQPGYKATWHAMFKGESDVPKWVSDASGPSSPSTSLSLEGQPYVLANSCKPTIAATTACWWRSVATRVPPTGCR